MKQRIITGVIAGALFLIFVLLGNLPFTLLVYAIAAVGLYELLKMKQIRILSVPGIIGLIITFSMLLPNSVQLKMLFHPTTYTKTEFLMIGVVLLLIYSVLVKNHFTFDDVGFILISALYVGIGFYYLIETRNAGLEFLIFALVIVWTTDSGAYFIGRKFGKKKLWPEISPNKTIEGFIGGIVSAVVFACIFQLFFPLSSSWIALIVISVIASIFGQMGDLVESAIKRHYSVKDSGRILPGHGGILDRFDSLLFVLPLLHFLQFI